MPQNIQIFGYGSLINLDSLKKTVPDVTSFFPALLENYTRVFETESTTRFTEQNVPVSVLNLRESPNVTVNGICFEMIEEHFDTLLTREKAYELKEITVKSWTTKTNFSAFVFLDKNNEKKDFLFDEPIQLDYLNICLDGAKKFGEDFYKMFLENTFINGCRLNSIKKLGHLL